MPSRRRLADGRASRGFIPLELELLECGLPAEAIGLIALMRLESATSELDGELDAVRLDVAATRGQVPKRRQEQRLRELRDAGSISRKNGGANDLNYGVWSKTRGERDGERARWRASQQAHRQAIAEGQLTLNVTGMSSRDMPVTPPDVTGMSPIVSQPPVPPPAPPPYPPAEAEAERTSLRSVPNGGWNSSSTEVLGARFAAHGRPPDAADLRFLSRIPYDFDRLTTVVVLAAIDDVAERFSTQGKAMPPASYLTGKLTALQTAAADAGARPRGAGSGLGRIGDVLQSTGNTQPVNPEEV